MLGRTVGRVPQEGEPGEADGLPRLAAALRGGDGGLCERSSLGPRDYAASATDVRLVRRST